MSVLSGPTLRAAADNFREATATSPGASARDLSPESSLGEQLFDLEGNTPTRSKSAR